MPALADHELTHRIQHEVSGLGSVKSWRGTVLDDYATPKLIDCHITVAEEEMLCVMGQDGTLRYFKDGEACHLPTPKSYGDDGLFASRVSALVDLTHQAVKADERATNRKLVIWFASCWLTALGLFVVAFLTNQGLWAGAALLTIGASFALCPVEDRSEFSLSKEICMKVAFSETTMHEFYQQLNQFTSAYGITFVGDLIGIEDDGQGLLLFKAMDKDGHLGRCGLNETGTTLFSVENYSVYAGIRRHMMERSGVNA